MLIGQMRHRVYLTTRIFVAQAESLHEYTAYRHTLSGKGPANFAGHSTRRPDTDVWTWGAHPESVPGRVCAPSVNVYLRTTADRSMYYYRTRTHRWLAMPKLSDHRPSSIHCGVYGERSEHLRRGLVIFWGEVVGLEFYFWEDWQINGNVRLGKGIVLPRFIG